MNMKPILFNTDMVRAILEGRKTVTRRAVKFRHGFNPYWSGYVPDGVVLYGSNNVPAAKAPYRPGDILYVRETWNRLLGEWIYKADQKPGFKNPGKWHPSIHMPREAARIFLRVTDVRVERLQEIKNEQAQAEGVKGWMVATDRDWDKNPNYILAFRHAWNSTIKPADRDLYGWDANPYVWRIDFEQCGKPESD